MRHPVTGLEVYDEIVFVERWSVVSTLLFCIHDVYRIVSLPRTISM